MSNDSKITETASGQRTSGLGRRFFSFKATQIILLIFSVLEGLIALRILLKLIGANPESQIVALIYGITNAFLIPFAGLISSPTMDGKVLEISAMFAITVYALTALAVEKLTWVIFFRPRSQTADVSEITASKHHPIL